MTLGNILQRPSNWAVFVSFWRSMALCCAIAFVSAALVASTPAVAQLLPNSPAEEEVAEPVADTFERQTPRSTVTALLNAIAAENYDRAAHYFPGVPDLMAAPIADSEKADNTETRVASSDGEPGDDADAIATRNERVAKAASLARKLKLALDGGGRLVPFAALSNLPAGLIDDGLDPSLERIGVIKAGDREQPLYIQQIVEPDTGIVQWRVAPETVDVLDEWEPPAEVVAAQDDGSTHVAGAPIFDWLQLLALAAALFIGLRFIAMGLLALLRSAIDEHDKNVAYRLIHAALPPLALYGAVVAFFILAGRMEVAIVARQTLLRGAGLAAWASLGWFLLRSIDAISRIAVERMHRNERRQAASIIALLRRGAKLVLVAIVFIAIFDTFGVDVTTGLAALGIGGLALALGAQKTIENLVGSVTIIADKPVEVGDSAQIGDVFGTVEDVGIRSTRIRTMDRTLVTIPNGDLAAERDRELRLSRPVPFPSDHRRQL